MGDRVRLEDAKWIWVPGYDDSTDPGRFVLFRKSFDLAQVPTTRCLVRVTADTRYRLYVNGERAGLGRARAIWDAGTLKRSTLPPISSPDATSSAPRS